MKKTQLDSIWVFNIFFVIVLAFIGIACFSNRKSNPSNMHIKHENQKMVANLNYNRKLIRQETPDKINKEVSKQKVNLDDRKTIYTNQISKGIKLAYTQIKSEKDYNELKTKLPKYVGNSMAKKIIDLDKPTLNQSGKKSIPFNGLKDIKIAYGQYNYRTQELESRVYVKYFSTMESVQLPGKNAPKTSGKVEGSNVFTLTINLKNDQIKMTKFEQGKGVDEVE